MAVEVIVLFRIVFPPDLNRRMGIDCVGNNRDLEMFCCRAVYLSSLLFLFIALFKKWARCVREEYCIEFEPLRLVYGHCLDKKAVGRGLDLWVKFEMLLPAQMFERCDE